LCFPGKGSHLPVGRHFSFGSRPSLLPCNPGFCFNFVDKIVNVPALPGKAAVLPSADTFLPRVAILIFSLQPNSVCYVIFCGDLINCADNRDACWRRTLPLNKCFNLTFIAICSFKRIRTETKRVSYVLCASHDISRIDPFVYLTSFKRRNNGEGEVFPILCFGSS